MQKKTNSPQSHQPAKKKKSWASLKMWMSYRFDNYISQGVMAQFFLLFLVILVIVLVFGVIAGFVSKQFNVGNAIWQSLIHIMDPGSIGGDEVSDFWYVAVMLLVTALGMAFTGTIVGIINNALSEKLDQLKKGHSQIIEEGHVVVIGFDDDIHTILTELEESNANYLGNRTIVVVDDEEEMGEMEDIVKEKRMHRLENTPWDKHKKKSKIIFRSGGIASESTYVMASVERARAIIINKDDDFAVIRVMLSLTTYLKRHNVYLNDRMPSIVTLMHQKGNVYAAVIAAGVYHESIHEEVKEDENRIRVLYFEDIIAHIFAQVCRQPGLSWVISEIFDYADSELYIEDRMKNGEKLDTVFCGKTFEEISKSLTNSVAIGLQRGAEIILNPNPETEIFQAGDKLIHLAEDDNEIEVDFSQNHKYIGEPANQENRHAAPYHFLVMGWNSSLPDVVANVDKYAAEGSTLKVLSVNREEDGIHTMCNGMKKTFSAEHIALECETLDIYNWMTLKNYLDSQIDWRDQNKNRPTNIVILCQEGMGKVEADEKAAVLLLNIREYLIKRKLDHIVNITTEMRLPEDQVLLSHTNANDFIVGSEIANRMMVQVANDPYIFFVFDELLNDRGSEIYLRQFHDYVDTTKPFNLNCIQRVARERVHVKEEKQEIILGWIRLGHKEVRPLVHLNPSRAEQEAVFTLQDEQDSLEKYRLVVLAYNI